HRGQNHHRRCRRADRPAAARHVGSRARQYPFERASMSEPDPPAIEEMPAPLQIEPTRIPWLGLVGVLLGTCISTLNTRFSSFGLADIRGALHAGIDEGVCITTATTVGQMLIAPVAIWVGGVYGARRTLIAAASALAVISLVEPFASNLHTLLALQFLSGLASGFFVPLTL